MSQFLPRGCHISEENRIKKMVANGCDWQIYLSTINEQICENAESHPIPSIARGIPFFPQL